MSDKWLWVEDTAPGMVVSHGICPPCSAELGGQVDAGHQVLTVADVPERESVTTIWGVIELGGEG